MAHHPSNAQRTLLCGLVHFICADGTGIVSGSHDKTVRIWDAVSGVPIGNPLRGHSDAVRSMAFSPDGTRIVSGSEDKTVRIWDAMSGAPIGKSLQGHSDWVLLVAFSPNGVSGCMKTVRIWNTLSGAPIGEPLHGAVLYRGASSVSSSPDGTCIIASCSDYTISILDTVGLANRRASTRAF